MLKFGISADKISSLRGANAQDLNLSDRLAVKTIKTTTPSVSFT